jgi:hypothetical protein
VAFVYVSHIAVGIAGREDSFVTVSGLSVAAGHVIRDDRVKASVLFVKYADVTTEIVLSRGEWSHSFG